MLCNKVLKKITQHLKKWPNLIGQENRGLKTNSLRHCLLRFLLTQLEKKSNNFWRMKYNKCKNDHIVISWIRVWTWIIRPYSAEGKFIHWITLPKLYSIVKCFVILSNLCCHDCLLYNYKATVWVFKTKRVCHVWCNFKPGYMCQTTVIFGTLEDGCLQTNSLALNNNFSYRVVFQNGINALSKMVLKKLNILCSLDHTILFKFQ